MEIKRSFSSKSLRIGIVDFFEWAGGLNIKNLSPVQKMTLKAVAGDLLDSTTPIAIKHPYGDLNFANEVEMFKYFSGKDSYDPNLYYSDISLAYGRRAGKSSTIAAGLIIYFATQFDYIPYLGTSPHATIPLISPTKAQATEIYLAIKSMLLRSPYLYQTFLDGEISRFQNEYSEEDLNGVFGGGTIVLNNRVHIKVLAADTSKLRGMAVPLAVLDEVAFFGVEGNDTKNTDKAILEAIMPALSQFTSVDGMAFVLKISSPNGQSGILFGDYMRRKENDILHMQVPSWYANPSLSIKYLENQKKKGLSYFMREYGAEFTSSETSYLDPNFIDNSIIKGATELDPQKGYRYVASMDFASKRDYWTFAIAHKEEVFNPETKEKEERVIQDVLMEWKGSDGAELDPSLVIIEIATKMKQFKISYCVADQYAFSALKPMFLKEGVTLKEFKMSGGSKLKMMYSLQVALNTGSLRMVHNPLAVQHLKDLRERKSAISNSVQISAANGAHDDYAMAIALNCYQFDKTSPLYIGHTYEEEVIEQQTKDANGNFITLPTATDLAEHVGNMNFYDNLKDYKNGVKQTSEEGNEDESNLWFVF